MKKSFFKFFLLPSIFVILFFGFFSKLVDSSDADDAYVDIKSDMAEDIPFPTVSYSIIPNKVKSSEEVTLMAQDQAFNVEYPKHYNWCLDEVPLNTKIAGSDDEFKGEEGNYYLENRYGKLEGGKGVCHLYELVNNSDYQKIEDKGKSPNWKMKALPDFYLRRIPNKDSDGDGLDDDWELKNFAGRQIPGKNTYFPSIDDKAALLDSVRINDDFDKDGWKFPYDDVSSLIKAPWMMGIPYAKNNITGSGNFVNFEEYTFGTDPLNPDTDGDGVTDEADAAGMNQMSIIVRIKKEENRVYNVVLYAFGSTQRWETDKKNEGRQWEKYFRADFPNKREGLEGLKKTEEDKNLMQVGGGSPIQIELGYTPYPAAYGEEIEVKAKALSMSNSSGNYTFDWYYKDEKGNFVKDEKQSGLNKDVYKFTAQKNTCREEIQLEVIDEKTRKIEFRQIEIPLSPNFTFDKKILGNVPFNYENKNISDFNAKDKPTPADYQTYINTDDPYLSEVDPQKGFRKGDLVEVSVLGLNENYNPSCFNGLPFEELMKNFSFGWILNGIEMVGKSGQGNDFSKIRFILTDEGRIEISSGADPKASISQGQEAISLDIKDLDGNLVTSRVEKLVVSLPYIELSSDTEKASSPQNGEDTGKIKYVQSEGKNATVNAHLFGFRPSENGFTYHWFRNGQEIKVEEEKKENQAAYTFKVGYDENGKPNNVSEEEIVLKVDSKAKQGICKQCGEQEEASKTIIISIPERKPQTEIGIGAAISKITPTYYRSLFAIAFIPALIAAVFLLSMGFDKARKKNN